MNQLTKEEQDYWDDVEKNLSVHIARFRKEKETALHAGKKKELEQERNDLKEYLESIYRGETATILQEQTLRKEQLKVLEELLKKK